MVQEVLDSSCTSYCKPLYMVTPLLTVLSHRECMHTEHLERIDSRHCDSRLVVPWRSQMCWKQDSFYIKALNLDCCMPGCCVMWRHEYILCVCALLLSTHSVLLLTVCYKLLQAAICSLHFWISGLFSLCERPEIQKWSIHIAACTSFVALC